jgi:hypothetical protein
MKERQYKRMKDLLERKELIRTNFGPEEDDESFKMFNEKTTHNKQHFRDDLLTQIKEKQERA